MEHRLQHALTKIDELNEKWPKVSFREISQFLGQINSMHPVMQGSCTLRSKMLQTFVNTRHFCDLPWDDKICSDFQGLFEKSKQELDFWKTEMKNLNFRTFKLPDPLCMGWVDASDHAIGGILVKLKPGGCKPMPVTVDNWILDGAGVLPRIRNCARVQVDVFTKEPQRITDHDLDPNVVEDLYIVHRNLTYTEKAVDSNERELLGAVELLLGCLQFVKNSVFTLHFDNLNAATILEKGSQKFRL